MNRHLIPVPDAGLRQKQGGRSFYTWACEELPPESERGAS